MTMRISIWMNKVLAVAGRVIRTEEDEGLILLLDDRFLDYRYRKSFPRELKDFQICTEQCSEKCEKFLVCERSFENFRDKS